MVISYRKQLKSSRDLSQVKCQNYQKNIKNDLIKRQGKLWTECQD